MEEELKLVKDSEENNGLFSLLFSLSLSGFLLYVTNIAASKLSKTLGTNND